MYPKKILINFFTISIFLVALTGCSGLSGVKPLGYSAKVSQHDSFVFGTFSQKRYGHQITGLWVELENIDTGSTFLFPFKTKNQFIAIPLKPSNYRIKQFYLAKGGFGPGTWVTGDYTTFPINTDYAYLAKPFKVEENQVVYLGDFFGVTGRGTPPSGVSLSFVGGIEKIEQNYNKAKEKLIEKYTNLSVLKTKSAY